MSCFVKGCKNVRRFLNPGQKISFHRFPKKQDKFNLWLEKLGVTNKKIVWRKTLLICSEHFNKSDIEVMEHKNKTIHLLKQTALPCVLLEPTTQNNRKRHNSDTFESNTTNLSLPSTSQPRGNKQISREEVWVSACDRCNPEAKDGSEPNWYGKFRLCSNLNCKNKMFLNVLGIEMHLHGVPTLSSSLVSNVADDHSYARFIDPLPLTANGAKYHEDNLLNIEEDNNTEPENMDTKERITSEEDILDKEKNKLSEEMFSVIKNLQSMEEVETFRTILASSLDSL